jgi:hypothetical protein
MARVTPDEAAAKWRDRLSASTDQIKAGVARVQTAPGQMAARNADLWLQRVTASKDKWKSRVSSVSLQDWQQSMTDKGIPRVAQGAQANMPKVQNFMNEFLPYVSNVAAQVKQMPKGTVEAGIGAPVPLPRRPSADLRGGRCGIRT